MQSPRVRIVVVDDPTSIEQLIADLESVGAGLDIVGKASTQSQAIKTFRSEKPDIVLMDAESDTFDFHQVTRAIADSSDSARVIVWTNRQDPEFVTEMIAAGAFGYLLKSSSPEDLATSISWAARGESVITRNLTGTVLTELARLYRDAQQRAEDLKESYLTTVQSLAVALETKDDETGNHAKRVRDYATIIAARYQPDLLESGSLTFGFLLHDVGKIGIPDSILLKPGPLDDHEWAVMKTHPTMGARILDSAKFLHPDAIDVVLSHHERWDGRGYPYGLTADQIPVGARLFAVADSFDAMTSDRPYRKALAVNEALAEIDRCAGTQFDPDIVESFHASLGDIEARRELEAAVSL